MCNTNMKTPVPNKYEGYVLKKKKWPMKGWHKRYFVLDNGFLKYGKTPQSVAKNKVHGIMDVGFSVMSTKKNSKTIDLDAEDNIFHLKIKSDDLYQMWVQCLRQHRDFRQLELKKDSTLPCSNTNETLKTSTSPSGDGDSMSKVCYNQADVSNDLNDAKQALSVLGDLLHKMHLDASLQPFIVPIPTSPNLSKKEKKQSKKASKKNHKASNNLHSASATSVTSIESSKVLSQANIKVPRESSQSLSHSNPDLTVLSGSTTASSVCNFEEDWLEIRMAKSQHSTPTHPQPSRTSTFSFSPTQNSLPAVVQLTKDHKTFLSVGTSLLQTLTNIFETICPKEEALQKNASINALKVTIQQLSMENQDLHSRLQRIHQDSFVPEHLQSSSSKKKFVLNRPMISQLSSESQLSITETTSEMFYDAEEYLLSDEESSSESDESEAGEDDASSEAELSDIESTSTQSLSYEVEEIELPYINVNERRSKLPCPRPETDVSLWNILKKNIGKDLSKVAMPVTLNEPLSALQLLCEEIEYCELLDKASNIPNKFDRMMYVAAFAVSSYGSTYYRAGQKPFNPILGETFECVREDKGFQFVAEQVSHHPPISVCHAHGDHFQYWQESRFKNKFWGKSMEIFPIGSVNVLLKEFDEHYKWNKVTSCVHNIVSGTRWIEHYGDMVITCQDVTCKISFSKSGYWNSRSGEVSGVITDLTGEIKHKLQGKWKDGIYCTTDSSNTKCIWRPVSMPPDYDQYYGFTKFAIELNEINLKESHFLPRTDSRFRPDQRYLEDGKIALAEDEKRRVEELQRSQKKTRDEKGINYQPTFFKKSVNSTDDSWTFNDTYWKIREEPGFAHFDQLPCLW